MCTAMERQCLTKTTICFYQICAEKSIKTFSSDCSQMGKDYICEIHQNLLKPVLPNAKWLHKRGIIRLIAFFFLLLLSLPSLLFSVLANERAIFLHTGVLSIIIKAVLIIHVIARWLLLNWALALVLGRVWGIFNLVQSGKNVCRNDSVGTWIGKNTKTFCPPPSRARTLGWRVAGGRIRWWIKEWNKSNCWMNELLNVYVINKITQKQISIYV